MHLQSRPLLGATAVAIAFGCTPSGPSGQAQFTAADSSAVAASREKWRSTLVARDFDGWATSVTPDVILHPPNLKPIVGRAAAVEYIKNNPVITRFDLVVDEQVGRGDLAYDRGTFVVALTLPDGTAASDTGSFLGVFRRQTDSTWAHDRVMWNSNLPVAPPPAPTRR